MKKLITCSLLSALTMSSSYAVTILGNGPLDLSGTFTDVNIAADGTMVVGSTVSVADVAIIAENGRSIRVTYELLSLASGSLIRNLNDDGDQFRGFSPNGAPSATPSSQVRASFTYMDGAQEAVSISNLSFISEDIDSRPKETDGTNDHIFSEVVGIDTFDVSSTSLSANTALQLRTDFEDGFTSVQLIDFANGNSPNTSDSDDPLDHVFTAGLNENSEFDFVLGLIGEDTEVTDNRRIRLGFTVVPEPSSTALLGLGALGFILRRRR